MKLMNPRNKQWAAAFTAAAMTLSLCPVSFAAGSLDHFQKSRTYEENTFTDISGWYSPYVIRGYELQLFDGIGGSRFSPNSSMTVGEAVKLAACLHKMYETGHPTFPESDPWWQVYADYCLENKLCSEPFSDYSNAISRAQFAELFAAALPEKALTPMNDIPDDAIPDVRMSDSFGPAVYQLYRAGILTGSDARGTFRPGTNIRRSEMAAVLTRMVCVQERKRVDLSPRRQPLNAEQIYAECADSVFFVKTFDKQDQPLSSGSGVFLTEDGGAVTNWHILDGAVRAEISTTNGKTYPVAGLLAYDPVKDLAHIKISGIHSKPIAVNSTGALLTGATVYAIGNPLGLQNSLSAGIISASHREVNHLNYIQITTPISSGSSGGALINAYGELIGITSASVSNGQNLNLAIPIHTFYTLEKKPLRSISTVMAEYVQALAKSLTLSQTTVRLAEEETAVITCALPNIPTGYALSYEISEPGIVQCVWGVWKDDAVELTLTGLQSGTVTVTLKLHNRQDEILETRTVSVTVR